MKKLMVILLSALLLFTSCKKKVEETPVDENDNIQTEVVDTSSQITDTDCIFIEAIMPHLPAGLTLQDFADSNGTQTLFSTLYEEGLTDTDLLKAESEDCEYADILQEYIDYVEAQSATEEPNNSTNPDSDLLQWEDVLKINPELEGMETIITELADGTVIEAPVWEWRGNDAEQAETDADAAAGQRRRDANLQAFLDELNGN